MSAEAPAADSVSSANASSPSAADAAKARREARKAKILGSGGDRLARITKTGRGEDAEAIYPSTPPVGTSNSTGVSTPLSARLPTDDPDDVDIAHFGGSAAAGRQGPSEQEMQGMMAEMFGGRSPLGGAQGPAAGMGTLGEQQSQDPLQQMMMAMQKQLGGGSGEPGEMPQLPFDLGAMLGGGAGGGAGGAGGLGGLFGGAQGGAPPPPKSRLDKVFDLLHLIVMLVLGFITVSAVFTRSTLEKDLTTTTLEGENLSLADETAGLQRWARLGYERPGEWETHFFAIAERLPFQNVSVWVLFVSLEIMLQSMRVLRVRQRGRSPSLINTIAAQIPFPAVRTTLQTGAQWWSLLSGFLDDLSILIFVLGLAILWSAWSTGHPIASVP